MIEDLIAKITTATNISESELRNMIEEKQVEMSGLISEEGAAYLVAKELGIILKRDAEKLNISNIVPGMLNVTFTGKVLRIFPVREFKTEKAEGRVVNIVLGDRSGSIRISLWNNEVEKIAGLEIGDVVNVKGYVKENMGQPEIRLGKKGFIIKTDSEGFEDIAEQERGADRSSISELRENMYRSVRAPVLQVFESNIFYEVCPTCSKRLKEETDGFMCAEHGIVEPDYGLRISGIIDDSTGNIRIVAFGEAAEALLDTNKKEAKKLFDRKKKLDAVLSLVPLGKEFIFEGRVRRNDFFDRLEFVVNRVKKVDVKKEIEMMLERK